MATLALAAAGAAAGSALLPTGLSILGATISGATIGAQAGALAGAFVDQSLFAASGRTRSVTGPRLSDLRVMASSEGAAIPRVYGRARVGGQVIWATDFEEEAVTTEAGGGKGGATGATSVRQTDYRYFANFAVALAAGEISARRPNLGGWRRARSVGHFLSHPYRQRDAGCRQPHRRPNGRRCAGLSRCRLCGVRASGTCCLRQSPAATLVRGLPRRRRPRQPGQGRRPDPRLGRILRCHLRRDAHRLRRPARRGKRPHQRRSGRCRGLARSIAEPIAERRLGFAGRQLVRHRPAMRAMPDRAEGRDRAEGHLAGRMVSRRIDAVDGDGGEPAPGEGRIWRHAFGSDDRRSDPQPACARAECHDQSVRADGHRRGQRTAQSAGRQPCPAGLSMARTHHLRSGARPAWNRRQDGCSRQPAGEFHRRRRTWRLCLVG